MTTKVLEVVIRGSFFLALIESRLFLINGVGFSDILRC